MSYDVVLVGHGLPLPVFLLDVLLQVEAALLGNVVLLEERLRRGQRGRRRGVREGAVSRRRTSLCLDTQTDGLLVKNHQSHQNKPRNQRLGSHCGSTWALELRVGKLGTG